MAKRAVLIQWQTIKMSNNIIKPYHGVDERWRGEVTSAFTLNKLCIIMAKRAVLIQWQLFKMLHNIIKSYHRGRGY